MRLNFKIRGQEIFESVGNRQVVADSVSFLTFGFDFSADWSDVKTFALFYRFGNPTPAQVEIVNGYCIVPAECITAPFMGFSVYGQNSNGKLITTPTYNLKVLASGLAVGNPPLDPPRNLYENVLNYVEQMEAMYNEAKPKYDYVVANLSRIDDCNTMIAECNSVISALNLVYTDNNGGDPTTDLSAYENDINGGYPSESEG